MAKQTPKQNAIKLVEQMTSILWDAGGNVSKPLIKSMVSKIIYEVLGALPQDQTEIVSYWQETKNELHKI